MQQRVPSSGSSESSQAEGKQASDAPVMALPSAPQYFLSNSIVRFLNAEYRERSRERGDLVSISAPWRSLRLNEGTCLLVRRRQLSLQFLSVFERRYRKEQRTRDLVSLSAP